MILLNLSPEMQSPYFTRRTAQSRLSAGDPGRRLLLIPDNARLRFRWDLECWPTIEENIPSAVLRANPKRFGKPLRISDPSLLSYLEPRRVMVKVLGWDEEADPHWKYADLYSLLGLRPGQPLRYDAGLNLVTDAGENITAKLLTGNAETALNNANAYLGVSSDSTAAAETDTSIPSATWRPMNATYPVNPSGSSFTLQSDYTSGLGNFAWNRWGIGNGSNPGTTGRLFSNKTESLGTKSGGTWTLSATPSID
jgi:hypothetical protein